MLFIFIYRYQIYNRFIALPHGAMGCLQFVIVVYPDHTHLLFWGIVGSMDIISY